MDIGNLIQYRLYNPYGEWSVMVYNTTGINIVQNYYNQIPKTQTLMKLRTDSQKRQQN